MSLKILQLHKRDSYEFKFIQDKVSFAEDQKCFSIADGTTQSFRSDVWAEMITDAFVKAPELDPKALVKLFRKCAEEFKNIEFKFSSNPAMASLERAKIKVGATATFIGVEIENTNQLSIVSLGDSNVFVLRNKEIQSFPFKSVDELDKNNYFLNTEKLLKNDLELGYFQRSTIQLGNNDFVILATDALSRLLLKNQAALDRLLQVQDFEHFHTFCLDYWNKRLLEEDDVTALIFHNNSSNTIYNISPPEGFSFPKAEEKEFIPSFRASGTSETRKDEMHDFTNQINHINTELYQVRKKAKRQTILLSVVMGLVLLNILFNIIPDSSKAQAVSIKNKLFQFNKVSGNNELKRKEAVKISSPTNENKQNSSKVMAKDDTAAEKVEETGLEAKVKVAPGVSNIKENVEQKTANTKK